MSYAIHKGAYNWSVNTGFRDEYGVIGVDVGRSSSLSRKSGESSWLRLDSWLRRSGWLKHGRWPRRGGWLRRRSWLRRDSWLKRGC